MQAMVPPFPSDHTVDADLGAYLLRRVLDDRWIHRRVESINFVGEGRVRRRISLDLEVPNEKFRLDARLPSSQRRIVPLTFLSKAAGREDACLRGFDLRDNDGRCLATLGTEENQLAAWTLLSTATKELAGSNELSQRELDELWAVVSLPADAARVRHSRLEAAFEAGKTSYPTITRAMMAEPDLFGFLLEWLSTYFLLLAVLDPDVNDGRRVLKLAYDTGVPARSRGMPGDRWRAIKATMGWSGVRIDPQHSVPLPCRSLHFEVEAPKQMVVTRALTRIVRREVERSIGPRAGTPMFHEREAIDTDLRTHATLAHVRQPRIPPAHVVQASFELDFEKGGSSSMVLWGSILLTAGLGTGALWPESIHQAEVAATMLVLAPGLLAGAAIVAGQHSAVALLRSGYRVLVGLVGVVSLVAAASLTALPVEAHAGQARYLGCVWTVLFVVALLITGALLPAVYLGARRWYPEGDG